MRRALILAIGGATLALLAWQAFAAVSDDASSSGGGLDVAEPDAGNGIFSGLADAIDSALAPSVDVAEVRAVSAEANVAAFLRTIRAAEGTSGPDGYRTLFGGELFDSFADHPRIAVTAKLGGKTITSTAAGAYQILVRTWDDVRSHMALADFSPASQDAAAIYLIQRRGALEDVRSGRFEAAMQKCAREWASLPGSPYGQPVKTLAQVRAIYEDAGGAYA